MERQIFTHEFADKEVMNKFKELSKPDIIKALENAKLKGKLCTIK